MYLSKELLEIVLIISTFSNVWISFLIKPGKLLDFIPFYASKVIPMKWRKFKTVLFECEACFAGQIALWWSLFNVPTFTEVFIITILSIYIASLLGKLINL